MVSPRAQLIYMGSSTVAESHLVALQLPAGSKPGLGLDPSYRYMTLAVLSEHIATSVC